MTYYHSSGAAASLLGTNEPRLNGFIRRGKISPLPELIAGRRAWLPLHIVQAAELLGVPVPEELISELPGSEHGVHQNDGEQAE